MAANLPVYAKQISSTCIRESKRLFFSSASVKPMVGMKPGTPIPGMDFMKSDEAPVAKERSEYPDWVSDLAKPMTTLAALRKMPEEEASEQDKMRYLKLTRRIEIKENNIEAGIKK